jgi:hypothetical protein
MSKPDLILANEAGENFYIEYKSTSSKKEEWINSWNTAIQLHSTVRAVEATLGISVVGVQIVGLYKGYRSYDKQNSPFCYAYRRPPSPPFTVEDLSVEYKSGYKRYPTHLLTGGVKAWVDCLPEALLTEQFPMSPPIYIKEELVDTFFRQRALREGEISHALQMITVDEDGKIVGLARDFIDAFFPQRFDQCQPAYGKGCPYRRICHGGVDRPLEQGFEMREPHHDPERLALTAAFLNAILPASTEQEPS